MKLFQTVSCILILAALAACATSGSKSGVGMRLPPGDIEKGRLAFIDLDCHTCHRVSGADLPTAHSPLNYKVYLGGEVIKVKTYGQLVTAILHPSHDIAKGFEAEVNEDESSPMPQFNDIMTTQQMIDLLAFLQGSYSQIIDDNYHFLD